MMSETSSRRLLNKAKINKKRRKRKNKIKTRIEINLNSHNLILERIF